MKEHDRQLSCSFCYTPNNSPEMGEVIGEIWGKFSGENGYVRIPGKMNQKALGIYTDYASDVNGDYTVMAACEVSENVCEESAQKLGMEVRKIPAGNYAKFVIKGKRNQVVAEAWQEIWKMDLKRSYQYDFEEYQNTDVGDAEVHIYRIIIRMDSK